MTNNTKGQERNLRGSDTRKGSDLMELSHEARNQLDCAQEASTSVLGTNVQGFYKGLAVGKLLGEGRFSKVYEASLPKAPAITFALKVYYERPELCMREAEALEKLAGNPHVVEIKDTGLYDGKQCLLMERAKHSLRKELSTSPLTGSARLTWALDVFSQALDAVTSAHKLGIVHGDIKPDNILLTGNTVKMTDFNLSKTDAVQNLEGRLVVPDRAESLSGMAGTLSYTAPDTIRSPRSDVYSLGVVLYELLTGKLPVGRYAPASKKSGAPQWVDEVIDKALSADASERYKNAEELQNAIKGLAGKTTPSLAERLLNRAATIDIGDLCTRALKGIGKSVWTTTKYTVLLPYTLAYHCCDDAKSGEEMPRELKAFFLGSLFTGLAAIPYFIGLNMYRDSALLRELRDSPPKGRIVWYDASAQRIKSVAGKDLGNENLLPSIVVTDLSGVIDMQKGPNGSVYVLRWYDGGGEVQKVDPATGIVKSIVKLNELKDASQMVVNSDGEVSVLVGNKWHVTKADKLEELAVFTDPGTPTPESPDGKYRLERDGLISTLQVVKPNDSFADRELLNYVSQYVWTNGE